MGTTGIGFWNQYTPVLTMAKNNASAQAATPRSTKKRGFANNDEGSRERVLEIHFASSINAVSSSSASGSTKRRRAASKSNNSA